MARNSVGTRSVRTVCIIGRDSLSTVISKKLLTNDLHVHLISQSSQSSLSSSPNLTFHTNPLSSSTSLIALFKSLSPPADLLISTSHGGDVALQVLLLDSAIDSHIPRFMPAEFGHDSTNPRIQALLPPYAARADFLELLRRRATSEGSIEWIGLATGYDLARRLADGNMGVDVAWQSATVFGTGGERWWASSAEFAGEAVWAVVRRWDEFRGRYLRIAELRASTGDVVRVLGDQMGCTFEVGYLDRDEGVREAERRMEGGWPDAGMFLLERSVLADESCFAGFVADEAVRAKLNLDGQKLDAVIKSSLHDLKHRGKGGCGCD